MYDRMVAHLVNSQQLWIQKNVYTSRFVRVILAQGAMLIFSASFQFYRMISEENPHVIIGAKAATSRAPPANWGKGPRAGPLLDLCVSSLPPRASRARPPSRPAACIDECQRALINCKKLGNSSRFVRVILAQGPC